MYIRTLTGNKLLCCLEASCLALYGHFSSGSSPPVMVAASVASPLSAYKPLNTGTKILLS